jgi:hypothetical protein
MAPTVLLVGESAAAGTRMTADAWRIGFLGPDPVQRLARREPIICALALQGERGIHGDPSDAAWQPLVHMPLRGPESMRDCRCDP